MTFSKSFLGFFYLSVFILASGCVSVIPLEGKYDTKFEFYSSSDEEAVWKKIIQYIATTNIEPSTLDKASGLVIATVSLSNNSKAVTCEKNGKPEDQKAWFVSECWDETMGYLFPANEGIVKFNIRLSKEKDKTLININTFPSLKYNRMNPMTKIRSGQITEMNAYSTGIWENQLFQVIGK